MQQMVPQTTRKQSEGLIQTKYVLYQQLKKTLTMSGTNYVKFLGQSSLFDRRGQNRSFFIFNFIFTSIFTIIIFIIII